MMRDVFADAINAPAGRLAEILLKKLSKETGGIGLTDSMQARFDKLVDAPGRAGTLARVRLAADVAYLFERAPEWTTAKIIPLFDWASADAADMWEARKYSSYFGSPELFGRIKKPFLEMFSRNDVSAEDVRTFAVWLTVILLANKRRTADLYPLSAAEARVAVRRAGIEALPSVGHRLAMKMEAGKPGEKGRLWRNIVGAVFQEIWPLDMELQSSAATFKLVQLLESTGDAFPEAVDAVIPLIRPDEPRGHSTVYSIAEASEALYASAPAKVLDLLTAVVGDAPPGSVYALGKALVRIKAVAPQLAGTRKFQKLSTVASG
jgi:hypothetical protein